MSDVEADPAAEVVPINRWVYAVGGPRLRHYE
jgi:hypothetical protein